MGEASVEPITLDLCSRWLYDGERVRHETGRFFSVVVARRDGVEQLLLDQPERGILGIVVASDGAGSNQFLLQHKVEPGNAPLLQYSPTVQATKSNYERVHGGAPTAYLEYFMGSLQDTDFDVLHSEQGSKFIQKFNRNLMTTVPLVSEVETRTNYEWLSAEKVRHLAGNSEILNTDTRSVLVSGLWSQLVEASREPFLGGSAPTALQAPLHESYATVRSDHVDDVLAFLAERHSVAARGSIDLVPLHQSSAVVVHDGGVDSRNGDPLLRYFAVETPQREVTAWHQPLYCQAHVNQVALVLRVVDGLAEFLLRAEPEIGFVDRVELSPSVSETSSDSYRAALAAIIDGSESSVIRAVRQSDEGGRFYRCLTDYEIIQVSQTSAPGDETRWLTLGELQELCLQTGYVSHETRMLISVVLSML